MFRFFRIGQVVQSKAQAKGPNELSAVELLPSEILVSIFSYLDQKSLGKIMQVTKLFATWARDDKVWQRHVHALLTVNPKLKSGENHYGFLCRYKSMYVSGLNKLSKLRGESLNVEVCKLLYFAAKYNLDAFFCMLLDKYPNIDVNSFKDKDNQNQTMAHQAAINNNVIILQKLIDKGANIRARADGYIHGGEMGMWFAEAGLSVLEIAASSSARECIALLLNTQQRMINDINSAWGRPALHYAAERGSLDCVKLLATVTTMRHTNKENKTAYELAKYAFAKEERHFACEKFLADEMQKNNIPIPNKQGSQCLLQ